jgi:hypothetical protein
LAIGRRIAGGVALGLLGLLVIIPVSAWASLALWYRLPAPEIARAGAAGLFAVGALTSLAAMIFRRAFKPLLALGIAFAAVLLWWSTILPARDGDWAPDVARQTTGAIDGDRLTLTDVRDFEWRGESDFTQNWAPHRYDLSGLRTLDLFLSYWAGPQMAHFILSFGFEGGEQLAWSVEVRRAKGGVYSPIGDLFKSNPLVILATDERDVVRVRTNVRGEDVRLYRLNTPPDAARALLRQYVEEANALADKPEFYNSITTNCTTAVAKMIRAAGGTLPFDWRLLLNGYLPGFLYDRRIVDARIPLSELMARASIGVSARAAGDSPDFSRLIRIGVPAPREAAAP